MPVAGRPRTANISTTTTVKATSCSRSLRNCRGAVTSSPLLIRSGSKPNWASVSAPSARAGVTIGRATACSPAWCAPTARRSRSHTMPSAVASARHPQERPRISFGTATCHCTSGRRRPNRKKARWSPGSSNKTRSCLPPSWLPTASVSPSSPTTSVRPCKPTTNRATRCGSRSWTSTGGKGNAHPRSFHSSIRGSTRMRRRDYITIGSGTTTRMQGVISARTR